MRYSVNQLGKLAAISVRTLHYYDEIGLLKPSLVAKNGYRYYEDKELIRLQQILFFRELDFPLDDIKRMLNRADFDIVAALREQKHLLQLKRARLNKLIQTINKNLISMNVDDDMYEAFKDEVKERWGDTNAYKQSTARVSKLTKAQMDKLKADGKAFTQKLADSMHLSPTSDEAQELIAQHFDGIKFFYDCPLSMYRNLGQMYVDDPRYYQAYPGLGTWLRDAIAHYCDVNQNE